MKYILSAILIFDIYLCRAQSTDEARVLKLSDKIFKWEVENKIDSLEKVLNGKFVVVNSKGESQTKKQYITVLKSGDFVHNEINVEENTAIVSNETATVFGKGKFTVTVSGKKIILPLSYMEVFLRTDKNAAWEVLAMHASILSQ